MANHSAENLVTRSRKVLSAKNSISVNSMDTSQVKVKYGEKRFCTFLIKDFTFAKKVQEIKKNCSPASNITQRYLHYRDEDVDMINLSEDPSGFISE